MKTNRESVNFLRERRTMMQWKPFAMVKSEEREEISASSAKKGVLVRRFHPHRRHVLGVALSGKKLLTCSADGTCQVFDRNDCSKPLLVYAEHSDAVFGCQFLDEEATIVLTWSRDCSAKVWNCSTGETILTLSHARPVKSAMCEGNIVVTFSLPFAISVWNLSTGSIIATLENVSSLASNLVLSLPFVAFGTFGHLLRVCRFSDDFQTLDLVSRLSGHSRSILATAINLQTKAILTGSEDKTSVLFDIASGETKMRFVGHAESVLSCAFCPSRDDLCLTTSADKTSRVWDATTGDCVMVLKCNDAVCCGVFNSGFALVGCADNSAMLFDVSQGAFDRLVTLCLGLKDKQSTVWCLPLEVVRRIKGFMI